MSLYFVKFIMAFKKTFEVNGIALKPTTTMLSGSQSVPYLNEDYVSNTKIAKSLYDFYSMSLEEREELGQKAIKYVKNNFPYKY